MKKGILQSSTALILLAMLNACAIKYPNDPDAPPVPVIRSLDRVKLITTTIQDPLDSSTFMQNFYLVTPMQRLLLRYSTFMNNLETIRTDGTNKVELQVTLVSAERLDAAKAGLVVCPLTRAWQMYATWTTNSPMYQNGWSTPGGDFDEPGCVKAYKNNDTSLLFDLTAWYTNYPKARNQNFGLILFSKDFAIPVYGENSGNYSPRLLWNS